MTRETEISSLTNGQRVTRRVGPMTAMSRPPVSPPAHGAHVTRSVVTGDEAANKTGTQDPILDLAVPLL